MSLYLRFAIFGLITSMCFAAQETRLETDLKMGERFLEQIEKQKIDRVFSDQIKSAKKELKAIREGVQDGRITNVTVSLLKLQKRIRSYPQQDKLNQALQHLSKIISSQGGFSISSHKEFGVQMADFSAPEGVVHFHFPDGLIESDPFTYSMRIAPRGSTDIERAENQKQLTAYKLVVATLPVQMNTTSHHIQVGSAPAPAIEVIFETAEGLEIAKTGIAVSNKSSQKKPEFETPENSSELEVDTQPPREPVIDIDIPHLLFQLPSVNQAGRLLEVRGTFDGIASNTDVRINENPSVIVAESPRKVVVLNPHLAGPQQIRLVENGKKVRCLYRNLDLRNWASASTLANGANAAFTVQLDSSPKLTSPVVIVLQNETPQIISLEGGPFQYITINPQDLNESGSITINRTLTGMQPAPFRIDARLDTTYLFSICRPPD